jgi:hypothetical protein
LKQALPSSYILLKVIRVGLACLKNILNVRPDPEQF